MRHVVLVTPHRLAYCRGVLRGVAAFAAARADWRFTLIDPLRADTRTLRKLAPDGIITLVFLPGQAPRLRRLGIPLVSIADSLPDLGLPLVTSDDLRAGQLAGGHLLATGLTRFAYIGYAGYGFSRRRLAGFRSVLQRDHTFANPYLLPGRADVDPSDDLQHDIGDLESWLIALPKPVGLFCANDVLGLRVIECCRTLGLRVPDDIAVIGVDDDDLLCEMARPPLSSVALPTAAIGQATAKLLDHLMTDAGARKPRGRRGEAPRILLPPLGVTARQSTDLRAVADPELAAALAFLRDNAHLPITIRDLLRAVPIARRALERRFRRHFARSPHEELLRLRLDRARQLLGGTDLSVAQIAERSGFSEARLLSAALMRADGLTARGYRERFTLRSTVGA